jgi:aminotransferase in exopolysaccharide biosynthesis
MENLISKKFIEVVRDRYGSGFIPLHRPVFEGNEKIYLDECIDSNFVSSVGKRVNEFEEKISQYTKSEYGVACVNGTSALHIALNLVGVKRGQDVISQALTFVATCNAISYLGASPLFIDVDLDTMGLSPKALNKFLKENVSIENGKPVNNINGRVIGACVPMHTFGHPCRIKEIVKICKEYNIPVVEDVAEALGSFENGIHVGNFGQIGTLSFNGNKLITTGGGGMLITNNSELALRAKHITTTAKIPHAYEFVHDDIGYNYRMPNINAALGCAQLERMQKMLENKRKTAAYYRDFFKSTNIEFFDERDGTKSNFWLNSIIFDSFNERNEFLKFTNDNGIMTRPIWTLMSKLEMFKNCINDGLENSEFLESRIVNIPSSVLEGY